MTQAPAPPELTDSPIEQALTIALEENQLPEGYRQSVRELIDQPEADWPRCCGSDCDPCVLTLQRAAARARQVAAKNQGGR
jgi:hypothetical protein